MARSSSSTPRPKLASGEVADSIIARLRVTEDGSLSNKRIERYALLRAEEVVSITAAWTIVMTTKGGNLPSSSYQSNVHKSRAFKGRLEALMTEKAELAAGGVWGQLEWQARQIYRKAAALDDLGKMQAATETLLKIAQRNDRPEGGGKPKDDDDKPSKGRGAPVAETPQPGDVVPNHRRNALVDK